MVAAFVSVSGTIGVRSAASQTPVPRVTLTLPKTTFLSTESVAASLAIDNTTRSTLSYNPGSVSFLIRDDDGTVLERHWLTTVSRPISISTIPAGSRRTFDVELPSCDVVSDPCSERVAVKLSLGNAGASRIPLVTSETSYSFVADPTATFRVPGLQGNRPIFIAQAEATLSILQRVLDVTFQFSAAATAYTTAPHEASEVQQIFAQRGLHGGSGFATNAEGFKVSVLLRDRDIDTAVEAAVSDVLLKFGSRVKVASTLFTPDDFEVFPIVTSAIDGTREKAQSMSDFIGGGGVAYVDGAELNGPALIAISHGGIDSSVAFAPLNGILSGDPSHPSEAATTKGLLGIRLQDTVAFEGAQVAFGPPLAVAGVRAQYLGEAATHFSGLPSRATLAADRPEIFAIAQTTKQISDRNGVEATALAAALAAARARSLAEQLGSRSGPTTLWAAFPDYVWSPATTLVAAGIAIAPVGNLDDSWQRLLPSQSARAPFAPIAIATPTPFPLPVQSVAAPATYLDSIIVPDERTRFETQADVPSVSRPDRLRLSVVLSRRAPGGGAVTLPARSDVEQALRAYSFVTNLSLRQSRVAEPPSIAMTIANVDSNAVNSIVFRIRQLYHGSDVTLMYEVAMAGKDCGALVLDAQKRSLDAALQAAVTRSLNGAPLRHLLLAIATPAYANSEDACDGGLPDPSERPMTSAPPVPSGRLIMHAPVRLVFRTR